MRALDAHSDTASSEGVDTGAVCAQLERLLVSETFSRRHRLRDFLAFLVTETLAGQRVTEERIAAEVLHRQKRFSCTSDSVVRVLAGRLRAVLAGYYGSEGQNDPVRVLLPQRSYVPVFSHWYGRVFDAQPQTCRSADGKRQEPGGSHRPDAAFELVARARHSLERWTAQGIAEALDGFLEALEIEPDCADAHSGAGAALALSAVFGSIPADVALAGARQRAERDVASRPTAAEPHSVLGFVYAMHGAWDHAETLLSRAVELAIGSPVPLLWYALAAALRQRSDLSIARARSAQRVAPGLAATHLISGLAWYLAGGRRQALDDFDLARSLEPSLLPASVAAGLALTDEGRPQQALTALAGCRRGRRPDAFATAALVYAHERAGCTLQASHLRRELDALARESYVPPLARAFAAAALGDIGGAAEAVNEARDERCVWLPCAASAPVFDGWANRTDGLTGRIRCPRAAREGSVARGCANESQITA